MAATLLDNLIDDLLPTVDELRGGLNEDFGTRQYVVSVVTRAWSGVERGDGEYTDTYLTIEPNPLVKIFAPSRGPHYVYMPQGTTEEGMIKISEISLANYVEADLTGGDLDKVTEVFWLLEENLGQETKSRRYTLFTPPVPDREKTIGWICYLKQATDFEDCPPPEDP